MQNKKNSPVQNSFKAKKKQTQNANLTGHYLTQFLYVNKQRHQKVEMMK